MKLPTAWWGRLRGTVTGSYQALSKEHTCLSATRLAEIESSLTGELWVAQLKNAEIISNGKLVTLADGRIITGVQALQGVSGGEQVRAFNRVRLLNQSHLSGRSLLLGAPCGNNYFHWLYDCLPRLRIADAAGIKLNEIDHFLVDEYANKALVTETVRIAGIAPSKVKYLQKRNILKCEVLVLPSMPVEVSGTFALHWIEWLRGLLAPQWCPELSAKAGKRLFIARERDTTRSLINGQEVQSALKGAGFETHYLRGSSVRDQAALFRSASLIVAQHGAALANLIFCDTKCGLVEIMSPGHTNNCYEHLAGMCGVYYERLFGSPGDHSNGLNITVDTSEVLSKIEKITKLLQTRYK
jgi:capsular polysaccharide biosynthesis protein